ncbi:hypothetical protein V2J09_008207 [Rumex salicifolius]
MSDTQRIHPSPDPERGDVTRPSAPLIPSSTDKSDKAYPLPSHPPPLPPPRRRRRCRLCRCLCCTLCAVFVFIILFVGVFAAVLFLGFHPKIPHYSIDGIQVDSLSTSATDGSLSATFSVNVTARNPNKRIGIYYEGGSSLGVWFNDTELCQGALPVFYQGHRNTTVMNVPLAGKVANATALAADLLAEQQSSGGVPLLIRGKVPVKIKMGKLKLMKIRFKAKCDILVDNLIANTKYV